MSHRTRLAGMIAGALFVAAACSSSSSTSAPAASAAVASPSVAATPSATATPTAPTASSTPEATGVVTALDPCQLVTSQEASKLAGATFGAGVPSTTSGHGKLCVYGGQTLNVFNVIVGQEPDVATAQSEKAAAQAQLQQAATKGVTITQLPNLGDGGVYVAGGGAVGSQTINISAIYVLKGTVFFGFSDLVLNRAAPTSAALQAQAQVVLSRLP